MIQRNVVSQRQKTLFVVDEAERDGEGEGEGLVTRKRNSKRLCESVKT
jgi:hypothetical protein